MSRTRDSVSISKHIAVIGTLDTKGRETQFVKELIIRRGYTPVVIDCGILGDPGFEPTVTRYQVAKAAESTIDELISRADKNAAIESMTLGTTEIVKGLFAEGKLDGLIALGGVQGTVIGTTAMQSLPLGIPKVMVSAIANGQTTFGPFVGTKDVTIIHSVADILGLNNITRKVLAEGVGAVVGMVETDLDEQSSNQPVVELTAGGVTTSCALHILEVLEAQGFEVIVFHCNGIGAKAMEELAEAGELDGIVDLSPHDITDFLFGGILPASPDRMEASCRMGVPQVVVPGIADVIVYGPIETVPNEMLERKHIIHNPIHTHVKTNQQEMAAVGRFIAKRLSRSCGPSAVLIPNLGFSQLNILGGPLFEPESDRGFVEGLNEVFDERDIDGISVKEFNLHINDAAFAVHVADAIITLMTNGALTST